MVTLTNEQFAALKLVANTGISHTRDLIYNGKITAAAAERVYDRIDTAREALSILADFHARPNEPVEKPVAQKTAEEIAEETVARYSDLTIDDLGHSAERIAAEAIEADRAQRGVKK